MMLTKPDMPPAAADIWDAIAPALISDGRLMPGDELQFAEYCRLMAIAAEAQEQVAREGMTLAVDGKKLQRNPAWNVWRDASSAARQIAKRYGMDPVSRKQLGIKRPRRSEAASISLSLEE